jgi:protein-tyrosine phosphatase
MVESTTHQAFQLLEISDASEILPNLWVGQKPPEGNLLAFHDIWDVVVLCAKEYQPAADRFPGLMVLHAPLDDSGAPITRDEMRIALRTARKLSDMIRNGKRILITCMQGRNRSSLVAALTICMTNNQIDSSKIISLIREARGEWALSNQTFVKFIQSYFDYNCSTSESF